MQRVASEGGYQRVMVLDVKAEVALPVAKPDRSFTSESYSTALLVPSLDFGGLSFEAQFVSPFLREMRREQSDALLRLLG